MIKKIIIIIRNKRGIINALPVRGGRGKDCAIILTLQCRKNLDNSNNNFPAESNYSKLFYFIS